MGAGVDETMMKPVLVLLLVLAPSCAIAAPAAPALPSASPGLTGQLVISEFDRNEDGKVDYRVHYGEAGSMVREELDFNYDGKMDDFCFYESGLLVREEIDTDFNGVVDVWVYLSEGTYILRYEMDRDGDGKPDYTKSFGSN